METKNLQSVFRALPDDVRQWLASERITYTLADLNKRLNINGDRRRVIPRLVARLATQDIDPRDFVSKLAIELNVSDSAAKIIVKEVEEKVLHKIEDSLRIIGIDIALLHFGKEVGEIESIATEDRRSRTEVATEERAGIKPQSVPVQGEPHIEIGVGGPDSWVRSPMSEVRELGGAEQKSAEAKPSGPFILHTEKEAVKPIVPPPRPTFSIRIPVNQKKYTPSAQPLRQVPSVTARIETGEENQISKIKYQKSEEAERQATEEKRVPANLPPLRRIGDKEHGAWSMEHGTKNANQEEGERGKGAGGGEDRIPLKPPVTIPKIVMPRPQVVQSDRGPMTGDRGVEEVKISPQIKKVVHYSHFFTKLD